MKFTKEEALEKIKAKLGNTHKLSDRTISESIEALLELATEETELTAFTNSVAKSLTSANGNIIKRESDFVKEWNEAHPQPTPAPTPAPTPESPVPPATDFAELMRKMDAISQELTGIKTKSKTETLIQAAEGLFSAKKPDPKWKSVQDKAKAIVNARIAADTTADVLATEYDREYNDLLSAFGAEGAYVPADNGGGGEVGKGDNQKHVKTLQDSGLLPKPDAAKT